MAEFAPHLMDAHESFSWLTYAGTALSALGAILNGTNSLYNMSSQVQHGAEVAVQAAPAVAGGMISGTVAVSSGWLAATALKVGAGAGTGLTMTTLSLGAGCMYASVGFLYFMYSIVQLSTVKPPRHAPAEGSEEARQYPAPDWMSTRVLNWGIMGRVGVGKSTLINALRGVTPRNAEAAPVGVGHTTRRPKPYSFAGDIAQLTRNMARLWDLPGAGTKDWPTDSYIRAAGLRHFDGVVFVTAGAFSDAEATLVSQLANFKVPYYLVRNKCDQDVVNNAQDNNAPLEDTLAEIRAELIEHGMDPKRTFLISAKHPDSSSLDFATLLRAMALDVASQRSALPEFEDEVPLHIPFKRAAMALADQCGQSSSCDIFQKVEPATPSTLSSTSCPQGTSSSSSSSVSDRSLRHRSSPCLLEFTSLSSSSTASPSGQWQQGAPCTNRQLHQRGGLSFLEEASSGGSTGRHMGYRDEERSHGAAVSSEALPYAANELRPRCLGFAEAEEHERRHAPASSQLPFSHSSCGSSSAACPARSLSAPVHSASWSPPAPAAAWSHPGQAERAMPPQGGQPTFRQAMPEEPTAAFAPAWMEPRDLDEQIARGHFVSV
eukprot:TRINITY_DN39324_c0_g1_i1.p1 TRINITY_DN39324_c0_g1~~TRINITY_DN39324_c0_g1_i1.p1  ORF type:complete len:604 (-),score=113.01 TRINITY_DN39324_c0_g1_i1:413-2224(-)